MLEFIIQGDLEAMQRCVDADPHCVNQTQENQLPPLYTAALSRDRKVIQWLLDRGAKVDIFASGYLGDVAKAEELLEQNPRFVRASTPDGRTALHYASLAGHAGVAEVFLRYGADVNAKDQRGRTPLVEACHGGPWKPGPEEKVVKLLLAHGAEVDLFTAAALGRVDQIDDLLMRDPNQIDGLNGEGKTALFIAASNNQLDAVKRLIECGADVNCGDAVGIAALHRTSQQASDELIQHLIDHGANAHLCCFVACGNVEGCRNSLTVNPAAIHEIFYEYNAVGYAIHCWQLDALRVLLEFGATLTAEDQQHILRISDNNEALLEELLSL
ncbi:MAG: ankyrin repeat domain-containing protein [Planctomycetaceae bacterium]|nr:ankyrin repeat domain-containing protein [Planctomycetaceae bacterium]